MKEYPKKYKDYFRSDSYQSRFDMWDVWVTDDYMDKDKYQNQVRDVMEQYYDNMWRDALNLAWINHKFEYQGKTRDSLTNNDIHLDSAYRMFFRKLMDKDTQTVVNNKPLKALASYADTFYPGFYTDPAPWKNNYKFPFEHITLDYLLAVWEMPDRIDFLEYAEEHELSLEDFYDYMVNWISCYNEENEETYTMRKTPFVTFNEI